MTVSIKKAGSVFLSLPLLLFIIFSLVPPSLAAGGSGEFSEGYKNDLKALFEEVIIKIELRDMDSVEAKASLALLRSKYRVEYNDFAGKIDALIDEVEESKKGYLDALNDFAMIQNNLTKVREQMKREQDAAQEGYSSGGGGGNPREKD